ncbi:L-aspartate oxidase [candidate division WOR-1 bacterium RIFOXYC2_FULL_37_10]|uniref:L-aspartate oxidase n=1 Tax=candidate division WOR-1 bacterium RIFOXYB2_FULL_37_13 TaxID=1802579 RepID=A0A1F4SDZ2_UNCSA|nr:MAG: L-aspartate oxidase [candidate division WOR-1 bacterium RIFOXYB2_FULL_37_13]OGC36830.1 MAG: L-aspartate oxidase [candidate division WOR-1 bacterium RIFOXYC2_FULL_37_10]
MQKSDILIIGGGIAGLAAALTASKFGNVTIITKSKIGDTATQKAQGGIAAAIDEKFDSTQYHFEDTIEAGAGLCDEEAVRILVNEGVTRVKELIEMGAQFDKAETEGGGKFSLTLEGAHKRRRILHAGDATGKEIEKTLAYEVMKQDNISVHPQTLGIDLLIIDNNCAGAKALDLKTNKIETYLAKATILATGGMCQIYLYTTNPKVATGDGIAMAYRAGAQIVDMEFIQFHPTSLLQLKQFEDIIALPQFLISEAVRGEGGILLNIKGERFMEKYHNQCELAPRDIVARAIFDEIKKTKTNYVNLQLSQIGADKIKRRFPVIYKTCMERGLDITKDNIPVAPAAHYAMGGIKTDTNGRTNIESLFAAGECSSLGIHGANRLASNSLLDGLVFGHRSALKASEKIKNKLLSPRVNEEQNRNAFFTDEEIHQFTLAIKINMWQKVGILRSGNDLKDALDKIKNIEDKMAFTPSTKQEIETKNMAQVAALICCGAIDRQESRGAHYRTDFPQRNDKNWKKHLTYNIMDKK